MSVNFGSANGSSPLAGNSRDGLEAQASQTKSNRLEDAVARLNSEIETLEQGFNLLEQRLGCAVLRPSTPAPAATAGSAQVSSAASPLTEHVRRQAIAVGQLNHRLGSIFDRLDL